MSATPDQPTKPDSRADVPPSLDGTRSVADDAGPTRTGFVGGVPTVAGYHLLERIGEGGMAVVYRGRDAVLGHEVAVKFIRSGGTTDRVRFLAEAQALAAVRHPNVVRVVTFGDTDESPYLAMEYLPGGSLAARLRAGGRMPVREAVELSAKLARAAQAAHDVDVIHRDLKPSNILFDAGGEPKVCDFGLAKRGGGIDLTATHAVLGTPAYMAPEQARGETKFVGPQADVYALGVVLYECLTGVRPFRAADPTHLLRLVADGVFASPRRLRPEIPRDAETVVLAAMARDPGRRYPTAARLADDLDRVLANRPVSVRRAGCVEQVARWAARKPTAALAVGLGAAVAVLLAVGAALALLWLDADRARNEAEGERDKAARALTAAERAGAALAAEQERTAVREYGQAMRLAHQAWRDHNLTAARHHLAGDHRRFHHWEWDYLRRLTEFETAKYVGHAGVVAAVAYSPDGTRVATGGWDKTVRIWDRAGGNLLRTFDKHSGRLWAVQFHPTTDRLLSADEDGNVYLWRGDTGAVVHAFRKYESVRNAAFSPDGARVVVCGHDKAARVFETDTAREVCKFGGHTALVAAAAFSADSSEVVSVAADGTACVWDARTGAEKRAARVHAGELRSVAVSPTDKRFAVCGGGGYAAIWDAATMTEATRLGGPYPFLWMVAYSPDGRRVAGAGYNSAVVVWEAATGKQVRRLLGHSEQAWAVAYHPNGTAILSGSADRTGREWPADEDQACRTVVESNRPVRRGAYSPDGRWLVVGGEEDQLRVFDADTLALRHTIPGPTRGVIDLAFSADGSALAVVGRSELRLWNPADWTAPPRSAAVTDANFTSVAVDRAAAVVVTGDTTGRVRTWTREAAAVRSFRGGGAALSVALTPDGGTAVTADDAGAVTVWDASTGERRRTIVEGGGRQAFANLDPSGAWAVTGGRDRDIRVWNVATGETRARLFGHSGEVQWAAFSPDGKRVVSAAEDMEAKLWDAASGAEVLSLKGHTGLVSFAAFHPDGTRLVTAGHDNKALLWDARARK